MKRTLAALVLLLPAGALAAPARVTCLLEGPPFVKDAAYSVKDYKILVDAAFDFDPAELKVKPAATDAGCFPIGRKSKVFGRKDGTRLQIAGWTCGGGEPYYTVKALINGLPVTMSLKSSRLVTTFNGDSSGRRDDEGVRVDPGGELPPNKPLKVPEGLFHFLTVSCDVSAKPTP